MGERRALLDDFLGPDLDVGSDHCAVTDFRAVGENAILPDQRALADAHARGAHRLGNTSAPAHPAVLPKHHVVQLGTVLDDRARTNDNILQYGIGADVGVAAEQNGPAEPHVLAERRARLTPHGGAIHRSLVAAQAEPYPSLENVFVRAAVLVQVTDITPVPLGNVAVQRRTLAQHPRKEVLGEIEIRSYRNAGEGSRLKDIDPGVYGVAEHLAPGGLLEEPLDAAGLRVGNHDAE